MRIVEEVLANQTELKERVKEKNPIPTQPSKFSVVGNG